jgi:organic hydroperoxide reductase OsmC/OhrA
MEWREEGGRDSNESSQVRSAWENKKERTVPKGTTDPVVPPGLPAPERVLLAMLSSCFSMGLAAKSVSGGADDVRLQLSFLRTRDIKFHAKYPWD